MKRWGPLSKFSNQGWEHLNAIVKRYYYRRTNKGGGKQCIFLGEGDEMNRDFNRLYPLALLLQRRVMWFAKYLTKSSLFRTPEIVVEEYSSHYEQDDAEVDEFEGVFL